LRIENVLPSLDRVPEIASDERVPEYVVEEVVSCLRDLPRLLLACPRARGTT
jgi:hypothetical protein